MPKDENELNELLKKKETYEKQLKIYLLPKDEADGKNAILEIIRFSFMYNFFICILKKYGF